VTKREAAHNTGGKVESTTDGEEGVGKKHDSVTMIRKSSRFKRDTQPKDRCPALQRKIKEKTKQRSIHTKSIKEWEEKKKPGL